MGCWNQTCALTNLPILNGDDVYTFILIQTPNARTSLCHPTAFWEPMPLFFEGKYNDYGSVDNCNGLMIPTITDFIKNNLIEFEVGENSCHDIAVSKDGFDLNKLFETEHKDRLYITNPIFGGKQSVKHIEIRKQVLDSLLKAYTIEEYVGYDVETQNIGYAQHSFDDMLNFGYSFLDITKKLEKESFKRWDIFEYSTCRFTNHLPSDIKHNGLGVVITELLLKSLDADNVELSRTIIHQLCVYIWLHHIMNSGRRIWSPQSGAGSQETDTLVQKLIARITLNEADYIDHYFDEDDEDD